MICILCFGIVFVLDLVLCELFLSFIYHCFDFLYVAQINFAVVILVASSLNLCAYLMEQNIQHS